jgi:acyl dehydratase
MQPWSMRVTAAEAAEFAAALGCPIAPGHAAPVPLTFLTRASWTDHDTTSRPESLGFDPARTLHAGEQYRYERPLRIGDVLSVEGSVRERFTRQGRRGGALRFAVVRRRFRDPAGALVAEQYMTLAERDRPYADTAMAPRPDDNRRADPAAPPSAAVEVGNGVPGTGTGGTGTGGTGTGGTAVVTADGIARYARASGDLNLIHRDARIAREAGYPTVFAMGMFPAGLLASRVASHVASRAGLAAVVAFDVRFAAQVWPGDILKFLVGAGRRPEGERPSQGEWAPAGAGRLALSCVTQRGETVMTGGVVLRHAEEGPGQGWPIDT